MFAGTHSMSDGGGCRTSSSGSLGVLEVEADDIVGARSARRCLSFLRRECIAVSLRTTKVPLPWLFSLHHNVQAFCVVKSGDFSEYLPPKDLRSNSRHLLPEKPRGRRSSYIAFMSVSTDEQNSRTYRTTKLLVSASSCLTAANLQERGAD